MDIKPTGYPWHGSPGAVTLHHPVLHVHLPGIPDVRAVLCEAIDHVLDLQVPVALLVAPQRRVGGVAALEHDAQRAEAVLAAAQGVEELAQDVRPHPAAADALAERDADVDVAQAAQRLPADEAREAHGPPRAGQPWRDLVDDEGPRAQHVGALGPDRPAEEQDGRRLHAPAELGERRAVAASELPVVVAQLLVVASVQGVGVGPV